MIFNGRLACLFKRGSADGWCCMSGDTSWMVSGSGSGSGSGTGAGEAVVPEG